MGTFANPVTLYDNSVNGPSVETALRLMRSNQRAIMELPGALPAERCEIQGELISDGFITPTRSDIIVTLPENYASTSAVIKSINNSYRNENNVDEFLHEGMIISLRSEFSEYNISVVSSTANGGILLKSAESITLSEKYPLKLKLVSLAGSGYRWEECAESGVHSGEWETVAGDLEVTGKVMSDGAVVQREIVYDPVPVVNITLSEDLEATSSTPYEIDLSDYQAKRVMVLLTCPTDTTSKNGYVQIYYKGFDEPSHTNNFTLTSTSNIRYHRIEFFEDCGLSDMQVMSSDGGAKATCYKPVFSTSAVDVHDRFIDKVAFYLTTSPKTFLAGTQIKVYVATYRTI